MGNQEYSNTRQYRKSIYCIDETVDNGTLLFNTLTHEMVLISDLPAGLALPESDYRYLVKHWFFIQDGIDERSMSYLIRQSQVSNYHKQTRISLKSFTILTTTECNARCPYCYEYGIKKYSMKEQTALDVAQYIINRSSDTSVSLRWFGGEPLCNSSVINIITAKIRESNKSYHSSITTNGLLLDMFSDELLIDQWNLSSVQITIDGTRDTYNTTKGYVNCKSDPFSRVINNIERLLKLGIHIAIRLNVSLENTDDMLSLIDLLKEHFGIYNKFKIYAYPIFEGVGNPPFMPTENERELLYDNLVRINQKIYDSSVAVQSHLPQAKCHHCMADSGQSIVIFPDGRTSLCQHYNEEEVCGSIYDRQINSVKKIEWQKRADETEDCKDCFYYPVCFRLEKCPNEVICSEGERKNLLYQVRMAMVGEYNKWKTEGKI